MSEPIPDSVRSTASVKGHPIHPMLVSLPIGLLVGALIADFAYVLTSGGNFWAEAARWLLFGGLFTGVVASLFGFVDFFTIGYVRSHKGAWAHLLGNGLALVLTVVNLTMRPTDPIEDVPITGLILSLAVVVLLGVTGWLGGELVYRKRVGVMPRIDMP